MYLLLCRDGSLYCGIAPDVGKRLALHNSGRGARYIVPARRPAACVWKRRAADRSAASRLEAWVKRLGAGAKRALASGEATLRANHGGWTIRART